MAIEPATLREIFPNIHFNRWEVTSTVDGLPIARARFRPHFATSATCCSNPVFHLLARIIYGVPGTTFLGNRQWLSLVAALRAQPTPAPHDLFVRPTCGDLRIEPQKQVQMIIHHRITADTDREDLGELFDALLKPRFAV
jgi:hypothetical protein